ncbi:MAG: endonuclease III [Planctomycetes bacterium]|nr:endonuclease III [Planctomycetota bacterium]
MAKVRRAKRRAAGRRAAPRALAEPTAERKARARKTLDGLKALYPDADCALHHRSAYELLVATILSAQSTDALVNKVTPALFERYPDARALAKAVPAELEAAIHSTGFFRQKAKSLLGAARRIAEAYGGEVPATMEDLVTLPGVARKTANVILGTWFKVEEGIVVDTHVGRLAHRLGLTWSSRDEKDAVRIEEDLQKLIPRGDWTFFGHGMILHGRRVCAAKKPDCPACTLNGFCPSAFRAERSRTPGRAGRRGGGARRRARRGRG